MPFWPYYRWGNGCIVPRFLKNMYKTVKRGVKLLARAAKPSYPIRNPDYRRVDENPEVRQDKNSGATDK